MRTSAGETRYLDKAAAYLEIEPLFATGRLALLDHPQLSRELKLLERRPRAGGRTIVDHPSGRHDDHANALALAAAVALRVPGVRAAEVFDPDGIRVGPPGSFAERPASGAPALPVPDRDLWRREF